ncbi:hypothetical protein QE320_gp099 [Pseudomonas phage EM]|uniref:Uncharacterized protein n=1 Tax=Pseudomonas phage EM TaxID=2936914 RepID=A0AAE9HGL3_9CAUD|nr:hypothetical protein QE320_gp099 [Pseudomonas phage EM]UPW35955.1 hypothetical protein EM_170 [Pseudomonas phage EM]
MEKRTLNYLPCPDGRQIVRFGKQRLGFIEKVRKKWVYKPYGCEEKIVSEPFNSIGEIKAWIEDPNSIWPGPKLTN